MGYDELFLNQTLLDVHTQALAQQLWKWEPWWDNVQTIVKEIIF